MFTIMAVDGAQAASFDCQKAGNPTEKAVCTDKALSELDDYLARYYEAARLGLGDGAKCLASDQRAWIKDVRNACRADRSCLELAYYRRLATLHAIQPGATQLKIDLPQVPTLVTAIPPESEAAASGPGAKPHEVIGQLVWEKDDINHMGFAVRPETGQVQVIVFDMDIGNSPTHEALRYRIEKDAGASFIVRGVQARDGGFAMDRCRLVYRRRH